MLTFRTSITFAVMAFIVALAALLIAIQVRALRWATREEGAFRVPCLIRWPGRIQPGSISNEMISGLDWMPTLIAAVGEPEIKDKLLNGYQAGSRNFRVHLDGYNQLPYLTGQQERGARREFVYFNDDGDIVALEGTRGRGLHFGQKACVMSGLDIFAWIVLIILVTSAIAVFCIAGWLPGHIAKARGHPQAQAVTVAGWVTLICGFALWPVALIWAYVDVPASNNREPLP